MSIRATPESNLYESILAHHNQNWGECESSHILTKDYIAGLPMTVQFLTMAALLRLIWIVVTGYKKARYTSKFALLV